MSQSAFQRYLKIHYETRHQQLHQRLAVALRRDPAAELVNQGLNLISAAASSGVCIELSHGDLARFVLLVGGSEQGKLTVHLLTYCIRVVVVGAE